MLEIIPPMGDRAPRQMKDPGIRHLAIAVDDFDAPVEVRNKREVQFIAAPTGVQSNPLIYVGHGHGNYVHLSKRPQIFP